MDVIETIPLGNGLLLRVEDDDWGYFISVVQESKPQKNLYLSELIIWKDELPAEIERIKKMYK